MQTLLTSIKLSSPLLLLIVLGFILKRINLLDNNSSTKLSQLVLKLILPVNIFVSIYDSDFKTAFDGRLILFIIISNIILVIIISILAHFFTKDPKQLGAFLQSCVRGNYSIFGLPLAISIYGERMAAPMALAIAFLTPLYNVYAIALFEHYQEGNSNPFGQIINVLKTPIMIATILAVVLKLLHITIPSVLYETLNYISKSLTAISLINLGSGFNFKINKNTIKLLVIALIYKLIVIPGISLPLAVNLGFRDTALVVIMVTAAVPVATSAFSTAVCYDTDIDLTNSTVVYSYVACSITIPIILAIITSLGLI